MKRLITVCVGLIGLSACAHQELKAPCGPTASLSAVDTPCNPKPINLATAHGLEYRL